MTAGIVHGEMAATVCMVRYGDHDDAMICGTPAPDRHGMCEHEHHRGGPICDEHAAFSYCRECYSHPEHPHRCLVRFAEDH